MKKVWKHVTSVMLITVLVLMMLAGCTGETRSSDAPAVDNEVVNNSTINGVALADYTIVYSENAPVYCQRAAQYIQTQIGERTGVTLEVCTAESGTYAHEILVGETDRDLSKQLNADTKHVEFATLADENHIAMEGDYFIIAAAAYFFVETYIPANDFNTTVPTEVSVHQPITEETNNVIFLIGDGMGYNHTDLFNLLRTENSTQYSDMEDIFYGKYLPYQGQVHTNSLSGVTDSAAAATALATGYKTENGFIGKDPEGKDLLSLTELANSKGMATAVMSTERSTGATPAGFSAHCYDRDEKLAIADSQDAIRSAGTKLVCGLESVGNVEPKITETLAFLDQSENGFFVMYEEAHIDKNSHNNDLHAVFDCMIRYNYAIGLFMEYAFYHPDTLVLITADHETGGLTTDGKFTSEEHTGVCVPIYAYGQDAEVFNQFDEENVVIPKLIAKLWGEENFGGTYE